MKYEVKNLCKNYGDLVIFNNLNLSFNEGEVTCLLGPSGCGKTTLLNIIAGAVSFNSGEITGFKNEDISYVFQEDRLLEWKTVKENLEFVLKNKLEKEKINDIIDKYLRLFHLENYKNYYPNKLSGGMRQRISIIRAYIYSSNILIMDEPFKSLDIENKQEVMDALVNLRKEEKRTTIIVTHDIDEAYYLGDRIITFSDKPVKVLEDEYR